MKKLTSLFILISFFSKAVNPPAIIFKENKGQWPEKVLFGTEFLDSKFYVNKNSFNYCVYKYNNLITSDIKIPKKESIIKGHNYEVIFMDGDLTSFTTKNTLPEYYNYFLGNDRSKWASKVKASTSLEFKEVYEGIDLHVYSTDVNLKYDFIISPNANPEQIKLNYKHVDGIDIRNHELVIKTSVGEITEKEPFTYQIINGLKQTVKCKYVLLEDNTIGFAFPNGYNKNYELVIDPVVIACSYSGTSSHTYCYSSTYDSKGNIYTAGGTDNGYPTTSGAFQVSAPGSYNIVLSAYNGNGTTKLFSTYLGGTEYEHPSDIHVSNNEITVLGLTDSPDYPFTKNAFDTILNGLSDLIITKLDITGSNLIASTFMGGSLDENIEQWLINGFSSIGAEMVFDSQKNIYVVSNSTSPDFPVTSGVLSTNRSGLSDAVVFKMDSAFTMLAWSTYLGGTAKENGLNIRLDGTGGVYVSGTTNSMDFPTSSTAYNPVKNGPAFEDMFVSHLNNTGTALIASTYLGTVTGDNGYFMDVDIFNNVYVCGHMASTSSSLFIPTPGVYKTHDGVNTLYKLDASLSTLGFKTRFGPAIGSFQPKLFYTAFKVDSCSNIYIAGVAWRDYPTTPNEFVSFNGVSTDMYTVVFNPNCSSIRFASYFGGNALPPTGLSNVGDQSWGISHFDSRGILYQAIASSENLPTTPGAYSASYSNTTTTQRIYNDAFLKADVGTFVNANSSYGSGIIGCPAPFTANFIGTTNTGTTFWDFGDGNTSVQDTISHTYLNLGTYNVLLVVTDTNTCNKIDSVKSVLNVINPTAFDLGEDVYKCPDSPFLLKSNVAAITYSWSTGQTTSNISVNQPGTYSLTIFNGGCYSTDEITVLKGEEGVEESFPNVITPNDDGINDMIDFTKYKFGEVEFILFDRWGRERYKTTNPNEKWLPNDLNNGTYYYVVNYNSNCSGKHSTAKGYITLFK